MLCNIGKIKVNEYGDTRLYSSESMHFVDMFIC